MPEHMQTLRQMKALDKLISLLSEDNEYIVTQVCGILNNLSSSSLENVDSLRSLNNPHFLTLLRKDRNRGVALNRYSRTWVSFNAEISTVEVYSNHFLASENGKK